MKKAFFLLTLPLFSFCCESSETKIQTIKNNSKDTLVVESTLSGTSSNTLVFPDKETDVTYDYNFGSSAEVLCNSISDSISVTTTTKKKLKKDLKNNDNWVSKYEKGKCSTHQKCTFEVSDKDF